MPRATLALVTVLAVAGLTQVSPATAQTTLAVPSTIASDCSVDVTTALGDFLRGVPNGTTVSFAPAGCYRVETEIGLNFQQGITLEGNGATLRRTQPTPAALRYPESNAFLMVTQWSDSTIRNLNIQGINTTSDVAMLGDAYGAWDQSMEFDAGINLRGGSNVVLENLHIDGTYGDGVQIQRRHGNPTGIVLRDIVIGHNGRQGVSISAGNGILLDRVTIQGSRRGGVDIEPAAVTMVAQNIEIRNSTIATWLLAFPSQGSGLSNHVYIHDNVITRTGVPFVKVRSSAGLWRTDWRVVNNTVTYGLGSPQPAMLFDRVSDVLVDGNVINLKEDRSEMAVGLQNGSTAVISNNWFRNAKPAPDFVAIIDGGSWIGGNNAVGAAPPSLVRWTPPVVAPAGPAPGGAEPPAPKPGAEAQGPRKGTPKAKAAPAASPRKVTRLRFDVTEPARKGQPVRAKGKLLRVGGDTPKTYLGYSARRVVVQFQPAGATTFQTVQRVRTGANGTFRLRNGVTAGASGSWRAVFRGNDRYRPSVSLPDVVRVKPARPAAVTTPVSDPSAAGGAVLIL